MAAQLHITHCAISNAIAVTGQNTDQIPVDLILKQFGHKLPEMTMGESVVSGARLETLKDTI